MSTPRPPLDGSVEAAFGTSRRQPVVDLLHTARREQWHVTLVEAALTACTDQIHQYRDWWAAVKVAKDREVREASARALDCTEHGHIIDSLEKQLAHFEHTYRAADRSRRAYLTGVHQLADSIHRIQKRIRDGDTDGLPDLPAFVDTLAGVLDDIQTEANRR